MSYFFSFFFFFNDTATTEIYTLSLHDALPISAGERSGHGLHSSVNVGEDLDVGAVPLVLPRVQVAAVAPVEGRYQRAVDEEDFLGLPVLEVLDRAADYFGEVGGHLVGVVEGGGLADAEVLAEFGERHVPPQPAQAQPERLRYRKLPAPAGGRVPGFCQFLLGQFDNELRRADAQPWQATVHLAAALLAGVVSWQNSHYARRAYLRVRHAALESLKICVSEQLQ